MSAWEVERFDEASPNFHRRDGEEIEVVGEEVVHGEPLDRAQSV